MYLKTSTSQHKEEQNYWSVCLRQVVVWYCSSLIRSHDTKPSPVHVGKAFKSRLCNKIVFHAQLKSTAHSCPLKLLLSISTFLLLPVSSRSSLYCFLSCNLKNKNKRINKWKVSPTCFKKQVNSSEVLQLIEQTYPTAEDWWFTRLSRNEREQKLEMCCPLVAQNIKPFTTAFFPPSHCKCSFWALTACYLDKYKQDSKKQKLNNKV